MEIDFFIFVVEGIIVFIFKKKFVFFIYFVIGDFLFEGIVYLRLFLIFVNFDVGCVVEVCFFFIYFKREEKMRRRVLISFVR